MCILFAVTAALASHAPWGEGFAAASAAAATLALPSAALPSPASYPTRLILVRIAVAHSHRTYSCAFGRHRSSCLACPAGIRRVRQQQHSNSLPPPPPAFSGPPLSRVASRSSVADRGIACSQDPRTRTWLSPRQLPHGPNEERYAREDLVEQTVVNQPPITSLSVAMMATLAAACQSNRAPRSKPRSQSQ